MKSFATLVGTVVLVMVGTVALSLLLAFPTKWLVNYIFSDGFRLAAFGVLKIDVWRAWALNILITGLFKTTTSK
jgi:hypothetical protein